MEAIVFTTKINNKNLGRLKPKQNNRRYIETKEKTTKLKQAEMQHKTQQPTVVTVMKVEDRVAQGVFWTVLPTLSGYFPHLSIDIF
jgi:hypothetical protein